MLFATGLQAAALPQAVCCRVAGPPAHPWPRHHLWGCNLGKWSCTSLPWGTKPHWLLPRATRLPEQFVVAGEPHRASPTLARPSPAVRNPHHALRHTASTLAGPTALPAAPQHPGCATAIPTTVPCTQASLGFDTLEPCRQWCPKLITVYAIAGCLFCLRSC